MGSSFGDGTADGEQLCCCPCGGLERASFVNESKIPSFTGDLPSPFQVASWIPRNSGQLVYISDKAIRSYVRRAAQYHGIPYAAIAAILQLENAPTASKFRQFLQAGERTVQGVANGFDHVARNALGVDADDIPKLPKDLDEKIRKFARGSSGVTNMSDGTLNSAIEYTLETYCKNPIADSDRYGLFKIDADLRITGYDMIADFYYCAAHIRQNIDALLGGPCFKGTLDDAQMIRIIAAYNGTGAAATRYGTEGVSAINAAIAKSGKLYWYE